MNTPILIFLCCIVDHIAGYNVQREAQYNFVPYNPYSVTQLNGYEPSQRLFWGNNGSNQVGGTGLWATLTNKFPFLNNMFGKMELSPEYGLPIVAQNYGALNRFQPQSYQAQSYQPRSYQPQSYQAQSYQPQSYQPQSYQAQYYQPQLRQQLPSARDVGLTDDAVIVTPPQVPIAPENPTETQFPTRPQYPTAPQYPNRPQYPTAPQYPTGAQFPTGPQYPTGPQPAPQPSPGYQYNKPLYRLELPHK